MIKQDEAELRARAAEYAAALLVERPELCRDELQSLTDAMAVVANEQTYAVCLASCLAAILERDDEDTDETARLIFEALAK